MFNKKRKSGILGHMIKSILLKMGIVTILVIGGIYVIVYFLNLSSRSILEITKNFSSGVVENEFHSYILKVEGLNRLQVASLKSTDTFSKKDSKSILWDLVVLPDVVVELKAPVEYTYFIDLKEKWEFKWEAKDSSILVIAPLIQSGTPAVDVSKMEIFEKRGSFFRDVDEVKEKLRSELSSKLKYVADEKIPLISETARIETMHFIKNWFINYYFNDSEFKPKNLVVYFSDEDIPLGTSDLIKLKKNE